MTSPAEDGPELRRALIDTARAMNDAGINVNKSGNVSARCNRGVQGGFIVTPTGVPYRELDLDDLVFVTLADAAAGMKEPSSEWRFHRDIYAARPNSGVVHTHFGARHRARVPRPRVARLSLHGGAGRWS
jgi:L-fuculose-phosphate aldolase